MIHICLVVRDKDISFSDVLIQSILMHKKEGEKYRFYLICNEETCQKAHDLAKMIEKIYSNTEIAVLNNSEMADIPKLPNPYYSLFVPFYVDITEKLLVLKDCYIAKGNIAELTDICLDGKTSAACKDLALISEYFDPTKLTKCYFDTNLHIKEATKYFSTDVLLIDPVQYRRKYSVEQIMQLCQAQNWHNGVQDIWNMLLTDDVKHLPFKYNYSGLSEVSSVANLPIELYNEISHAKQDAILIKYTLKNVFTFEYAPYFWIYARQTTHYEQLLNIMFSGAAKAHSKSAVKELEAATRKQVPKSRKKRKKEQHIPLFGWSPFLEENIHTKGPSVQLQGLQQIELRILKEFDQFCTSHGFRYYLAGGTLLGAIRHEGFIPWDDDIDLLMPRKDYMEFLRLTNDGMNGYEVRSIYNSPRNHICHIARILDTRYMMQISKKMYGTPYFMPPWVDIFPMDGLPDEEDVSDKHFAKVKHLRELLARAWKPVKYLPGSKVRKAIKAILFFPLKIYGYNRIMKRIERVTMQYPYDDCSYVGAVGCGQGTVERMPKSVFEERIRAKFCDSEFWIPGGYDYYLTRLYGNYMAIPGDKNRKQHIERVWLVERN